MSQRGAYVAVLYDQNAQQFLIDNLPDILSWYEEARKEPGARGIKIGPIWSTSQIGPIFIRGCGLWPEAGRCLLLAGLHAAQHREDARGKGAVALWRKVDAIKQQGNVPGAGVRKVCAAFCGQGCIAGGQPGRLLQQRGLLHPGARTHRRGATSSTGHAGRSTSRQQAIRAATSSAVHQGCCKRSFVPSISTTVCPAGPAAPARPSSAGCAGISRPFWPASRISQPVLAASKPVHRTEAGYRPPR